MSRVRRAPELFWEFVIGDEWRLAVAVMLAIGGAAILAALGVDASSLGGLRTLASGAKANAQTEDRSRG
jgi:hypothetical protein